MKYNWWNFEVRLSCQYMMLIERNHFNRRKHEKQSLTLVTADNCSELMPSIILIILKTICR